MIDPGAIHISIGGKTGGRVSLSLTNTRTNAVARMLTTPENAPKARRLITFLYGLCPIAHLLAFDTAKLRARGFSEEDRRAADGSLCDIALFLEAAGETLRVLVMEASRLVGRMLPPDASAELMRIRAGLSVLSDTLLGLDPNNESNWQPDKNAPNGKRLVFKHEQLMLGLKTAERIYVDIVRLAEEELIGTTWREHAIIDSAESCVGPLETWAKTHASNRPAARLLYKFFSMPATQCEIETALLPTRYGKMTALFADELLHRMLREPGFDLAPFWAGSRRLTGACARLQDDPVGKALIAAYGLSPAAFIGARIMEVPRALRVIEKRIEELRIFLSDEPQKNDAAQQPSAPIPSWSPIWSYSPDEETNQNERTAIALLETARGLLAHSVSLSSEGEVTALKITSPTEWQFAPYGAAERLLISFGNASSSDEAYADKPAFERRIAEMLFGLDACVPLEFAWARRDAKSLGGYFSERKEHHA